MIMHAVAPVLASADRYARIAGAHPCSSLVAVRWVACAGSGAPASAGTEITIALPARTRDDPTCSATGKRWFVAACACDRRRRANHCRPRCSRRRMRPRELPTEQAPSGTSTSPTPSPPSESANRKSEGAATPTPTKGYSGRQPWPLHQRVKKRSSVERGDRHRAAVLAGLGRHNEGMRITASNRVLAVHDLELSGGWYRDVLGCEIDDVDAGNWRFDRAGESHSCSDDAPDVPAASDLGDHSHVAYLRVDDVDEFRRRAIGAGADVLKAPRDEPWGMREVGLRSPDGHRFMLGAPLGSA